MKHGSIRWANFGIWLAVVMVVFVDRIAKAQSGTGFANEAARQIVITKRALWHIEQRHWPDSPARNAGKFLPGITQDSLSDLINEAVANGRARPNTNGRPGQIYEYDFGRPIGVTINGLPATKLRVVVNANNRLVTAFPFS